MTAKTCKEVGRSGAKWESVVDCGVGVAATDEDGDWSAPVAPCRSMDREYLVATGCTRSLGGAVISRIT
jgi:hypothetical protein